MFLVIMLYVVLLLPGPMTVAWMDSVEVARHGPWCVFCLVFLPFVIVIPTVLVGAGVIAGCLYFLASGMTLTKRLLIVVPSPLLAAVALLRADGLHRIYELHLNGQEPSTGMLWAAAGYVLTAALAGALAWIATGRFTAG